MKGTIMRSVAKKILAFGLAGCMAMAGLAGCSQPQEGEAPAPAEEEQPTYDLVIGTEDDAVVNLPVANGTASDITGLQVKDVANANFSSNLMDADQVWEPGQVANIFFADVLIADTAVPKESSSSSSSGAAAASDSADAELNVDDLLLNDTYDLQITMADGTTAVLHQLALGTLMDAEELTINVDTASGAAYLTYVEDDASASTLDAELQYIAEQEAALAAAAEAEAAAAAAAQQANQSQPSGSTGGSGTSGGSYDSVAPSNGGGSGSSGSAPSQSEDNCVDPDDLIFN